MARMTNPFAPLDVEMSAYSESTPRREPGTPCNEHVHTLMTNVLTRAHCHDIEFDCGARNWMSGTTTCYASGTATYHGWRAARHRFRTWRARRWTAICYPWPNTLWYRIRWWRWP